MARVKTSEFLVGAKAVIDTPDKWVKGYVWVTRTTLPDNYVTYEKTMIESSNCFCSYGALEKHVYDSRDRKATMADASVRALNVLNDVAHKKGFAGIISLNDCQITTHESLMEVWDEAIQVAKEREERAKRKS